MSPQPPQYLMRLMRLILNPRTIDIAAILGYTGILTVLVAVRDSGAFLALPIIVLFPGYCTLAALFPRTDQLDVLQRSLGGIALSIAMVALVALALDLSPFGVTPRSLGIAAGSITLLTGITAFVLRRGQNRLTDEFTPETVEITKPSPNERGNRLAALALAAGLAIACILGAYLLVTPGPIEHYTELYALGLGDAAESYPYVLNESRRAQFTIGVVNHEGANVDYTVNLALIGLNLSFNSTSGQNETVETNRTNVSSDNLSIRDGEGWTKQAVVVVPSVGLWKLEVTLFVHGDLSTIYRLVVIYVRAG